LGYKKNRVFSLWLDFIERGFIESGEFKKLVDSGFVVGATSNPAIFQNAITSSERYLNDIRELKKAGKNNKEIYEILAINDIRESAKILENVYEQTGFDGFVSIEVDPFFADSVEETVREGLRLYKEINMKNIMIKIPATESGYLSMEKLASHGININATLIFSLDEAVKSAEAISRGIEKSDNKNVQAVLSVFVSRFDRATGSIYLGIANSSRIYREIESMNLKNIRVLFASTGVKGNHLPVDYYIYSMIAPNTVNTAPLNTINGYIKNNRNIEIALPLELEREREIFDEVAENGFELDNLILNLKRDGLEAFKDSLTGIFDFIDKVEIE